MKQQEVIKALQCGLQFMVELTKEGVSLRQAFGTSMCLDNIEFLMNNASEIKAYYKSLSLHQKSQVVLKVLEIDTFPGGKAYNDCWEVVRQVIQVACIMEGVAKSLKTNQPIWQLLSK